MDMDRDGDKYHLADKNTQSQQIKNRNTIHYLLFAVRRMNSSI